MNAFRSDCPHCSSKNAAFSIPCARYREFDERLECLAVCAVCNEPMLALFGPYHARLRSWAGRHEEVVVDPQLDEPSGYGGMVLPGDTYPRYEEAVEIPELLPERVQNYYRQGAATVHIAPDASGCVLRKSVEAALEEIDKELRGTFHDRLKALAAKGRLTKELVELGQQVRLDGNDAAHNEFTSKEAEAMRKFVELFLTYTFTLPVKVSGEVT